MQEAVAGVPALFLETTDSTNEEALRWARRGALAGPCWFAAKRQEKGRGRQGRVWQSAAGNLFASLAIPAFRDALVNGQMSFAAAVAVAETLATLDVAAIACKWPNDVLLAGHKVAGILLETAADPARQAWLVIGIGVNIASAPPDDAVTWPATALAVQGACDVDPQALLEALALRLMTWHQRLGYEGFAPLRAAWTGYAYGIGQRTRFKRGEALIEGQFLGLDDQGAARLRLDSGPETLVHAGELIFPQPGTG